MKLETLQSFKVNPRELLQLVDKFTHFIDHKDSTEEIADGESVGFYSLKKKPRANPGLGVLAQKKFEKIFDQQRSKYESEQ